MKQIDIDNILLTALSQGASDLHLAAGAKPMMRINDLLQPLSEDVLSPDDTFDVVCTLSNDDIMKRISAKGSMDFSYSIAGQGRYRVSVFKQRSTYSLSFRLCAQALPDEAELGLPTAVVRLAERKSGLVVLSGVSRSGKSTTAAWIINRIAATRPGHIITIEEPIEVLFRHGRGLVNQKEIGLDAPDRLTALVASLREDPDVLYISSANDAGVLSAALDAALSGKLVVCVLDTPNAAATLQYMLDVSQDTNKARLQAQLAEALAAIVSHRLVTVSGNKQIALFEVMLSSEAVRGLLRENKAFQLNKVIESSAHLGMQTFDRALARCVVNQQITLEAANSFIIDQQMYRHYLLELDI